MRQIYQADDILEANIVKGMLEHHGIDAHIHGQHLQGGIGLLPVTGLISLWVEDDQVSAARQLIDQYLAS
ncbi:MAG: DUF2007 domain-containing protein [Methylohalobius sp. ZOD2]